MIDKTAIIDPSAEIGSNVKIGPYSIIQKNVSIGDETVIDGHVQISEGTTMGRGCHIFPFNSIGTIPQDLKFGGEQSRLVIGDNNIIREFVTMNRGTSEGGGVTRVGDNNLFMAYTHIAHDCILGSNIIMANAATLGGHVFIEDNAIIGGLVAVHQFTRIGRFSMVGGCSAVNKDVPPYTSAVGNRVKLHGLNLVGLRRNRFSPKEISSLKRAYSLLFRHQLTMDNAIEQIKKELYTDNNIENTTPVDCLINFITSPEGKRGICSGAKT